jgi:hypothetical protein
VNQKGREREGGGKGNLRRVSVGCKRREEERGVCSMDKRGSKRLSRRFREGLKMCIKDASQWRQEGMSV